MEWTPPEKPPKESRPVMNYRNSETVSRSDGGSGGGSTMEKIVEKLKKFGYMDDVKETKEMYRRESLRKDLLRIFFILKREFYPTHKVVFRWTRHWGLKIRVTAMGRVRFPWERPKVEEGSVRIKSRTSLAELTLPESELRRLRNLTMRTKNKTKIGGGGVTQAVVDMIREKWKTSEIVKLKCEGAAALNMRRIHEILERKTGGLVIWRSGTSVSLYRGVSYEVPVQLNKRWECSSSGFKSKCACLSSNLDITDGENKDTESEVKYEDEIDKLLDGLGPRYTDWPGCDPLPIDADLLPGKIHGYQPPFRILPYGVRSSLGLKEATALRRLARVLPPHFALGRSRQLEGLAMAMIKLWERSSIAKVALKRGVQLTTSERMAEDIKVLNHT
ncbi:CRM-domain containing factor CFM3A, chloroplastic/mitochondrial [Vitis vinifera]|uniref:CRM-domain containing factor CFM3A, chloroplastic/mitochondrial n=1 Tax=Vitis vinifera TaxID=29760 RepID=A0A438F662_VITVI|nr:CRM-domain containing factor CFM3A, chloroplastic/mitochondrial [Vitis vinifera]